MKKTAVSGIIIALSVLLFIVVKCDNGNDPKDEVKKVITLLSPKGGAGVQFKAGDTVMISWKVDNSNPDSAKFGNVAIVGSTNGGTSFSIPISGNNPVPADTLVWTGSYRWIIGNECIAAQFVLKLYDYSVNSLSFDKSSSFVIVAP
jgi:hypothetical protein